MAMSIEKELKTLAKVTVYAWIGFLIVGWALKRFGVHVPTPASEGF